MEYLSAEISELRGLVKRKLGDWLGAFDEARVVVVHAVNVSPDLDLVCKEGRTDKRCRVV